MEFNSLKKMKREHCDRFEKNYNKKIIIKQSPKLWKITHVSVVDLHEILSFENDIYLKRVLLPSRLFPPRFDL